MYYLFRGFGRTTRAPLLAILLVGLLFQSGPASAEKPVMGNSLGMSFVLIPAGSFTMGSPPDEYGRAATETQHQVTISKSFYLQTTEVTVGQWRQIMGRRWFGDVKWPLDRPIAKVSWYDVQRFIEKLNQKMRVITACRQRPSGSTPPGPAEPPPLPGAVPLTAAEHCTDTAARGKMNAGTIISPGAWKKRCRRRLRGARPINGDCMTCTATSGNGAWMYLRTTGEKLWWIPANWIPGACGYAGAAAGSAAAMPCVLPIVLTAIPPAACRTLVFGWCSSLNHRLSVPSQR